MKYIQTVILAAVALFSSSCTTMDTSQLTSLLASAGLEYLQAEAKLSPENTAYLGIGTAVLADGKVTKEEIASVARAEINKQLARQDLTPDQRQQLAVLLDKAQAGELDMNSLKPLILNAAELYARSQGVTPGQARLAIAVVTALTKQGQPVVTPPEQGEIPPLL